MHNRAVCARHLAWLLALAIPASMAAQQPPASGRATTPTPGTPQPDPPNVADRIMLTGCVQLAANAGPAPATALTVPSDSRFVLAKAKKDPRAAPGASASAAASAPVAETYRLEALESQLSAFVGTQVEVSGEVKPAQGSQPPALLVEFVQKIAAKCP